MADSTDNLGQVGEDTSELIAAADADRNARAREQREERKEERESRDRGDLVRVSINAPHKAQCNGRDIALTIILPDNPSPGAKKPGIGDLNVYDTDGSLLHGGVDTLSIAIDDSDPPTKVDVAWYKDEFCVNVEGTNVTKTAFTLRTALS